MQLHRAVTILLISLSTVYGLRCYICVSAKPCLTSMTCPDNMDRCASINWEGLHIKSCVNSTVCEAPIDNLCCDQDLCNGAIAAGPSVVLLLVSSVVITLLL